MAISSKDRDIVRALATRLATGNANNQSIAESLAASAKGVTDDTWVDVGGLLMPQQRVNVLCGAIESGSIADVNAFHAALDGIVRTSAEDEWAWIRNALQKNAGVDFETINESDAISLVNRFVSACSTHLNAVLNDAAREFNERSQLGYGQDGQPEDASADFEAVRGTMDQNDFVRQIHDSLADLERRVGTLVGSSAQA